MRVARFDAYHVRIPLWFTVRHASHTRQDTDSLIVRCTLTDGTTGWGEGLPRSYVTGETIDSALSLFETTDLNQQCGGAWQTLDQAVELARAMDLGPPPADKRDSFGNTVRSALELSLLDAAARSCSQPLSDIVFSIPETVAIRKAADRVQYSGTITAMHPRRQWISAWLNRLWGFHQCKVKVGAAGIDDRDTVRRIRGILKPHVEIRVDANEAWTRDEAARQIARLEPFGISTVEQPLPHSQLENMAWLRQVTNTPLMLDESLCSLDDARRAIEYGTCDRFNLRISKCGGLTNTLLLAAMAHRAGLGYQLGCQVGETGILSAAGRHIACSIDHILSLEGSFDRFLVRNALTRENLTFARAGFAPALPGPGLGVTVQDSALHKVTIRSLTRRVG
ncbi:MAG: enolase C-terminal domain-like protein [Planctomycetaceae bacterium]